HHNAGSFLDCFHIQAACNGGGLGAVEDKPLSRGGRLLLQVLPRWGTEQLSTACQVGADWIGRIRHPGTLLEYTPAGRAAEGDGVHVTTPPWGASPGERREGSRP